MASTHGWEKLDAVGKYVLVPDKKPRQVSSAAKIFVNRRYGPEAVVASVDTPAGAFVMLAYLPPEPAALPKPTSVEPRAEDQKPRRTMDDAARQARNPSMNNPEVREAEKERKRREATEAFEKRRAAEEAEERHKNSHPNSDEEGWAALDVEDDGE